MTSTGSGDTLWRDTFGLRKIVVVATGTGKVFGIETLKGKIVWTIKLGAGSPDLSMKVHLTLLSLWCIVANLVSLDKPHSNDSPQDRLGWIPPRGGAGC